MSSVRYGFLGIVACAGLLAIAACGDDDDDGGGDHPTCQDATCLDRQPKLNPLARCTKSEECTDKDAGYGGVCREGQCVTITSSVCNRIYGNWLDPNVILLGSIDSKIVELEPSGEERQQGMELAAYQWASVRLRRPLALVECDDSRIPSYTAEAIRHLSGVVNVPGLIVSSDDRLAMLHETITDRRIAVVCSECVAPSPSDISDIYVRRIYPHLAQEVLLANEVIKSLDPKIRTESALPEAAAIRVAIVAEDKPASRSFASSLEALATSKSVALKTFVPLEQSLPVDVPALVKAAEDVTAFAPHVVVFSLGRQLSTVMESIDLKTPVGQPRPYYVPNALALRHGGKGLFQWAFQKPEVLNHIVGVAPELTVRSQANYERYRFYFQVLHHKLPSESIESFASFDAFHSLAYAVVAAMQASPTPTIEGSGVAAGFSRLTGAEALHPVNVGIDSLDLGAGVVASGGAIDLVGVTNDLDWDLPTGDIHTNSSTYCLGPDPSFNPDAGVSSGAIGLRRDGGLTWSRLGQKPSGAINCF